MRRSYIRQLDCGQQLLQGEDGGLKTYYCGNRSCLICSGIRTAKAITSYGDEVRSWGKNAYLLTLTTPNVSKFLLRPALKKMMSDLRVCSKYLKYHHGKVKFVRTTEVTFNAENDTFHPHFHLIVQGYQVGVDLMRKWVSVVPGASILAQDLRPANADAVREVFKYATKLVSEKKGIDGKRKAVPAWALHEMFSAIKGLRLIGVTGFQAKKKIEEEGQLEVEGVTLSPVRLGEVVEWDWAQSITDWADFSTGEILSGYEPSRRAVEFIKQLQEE
jgi:hypothetical protein